MKPIEFHYWPTPNGWKVAIALEEMALPYAVHLVNLAKGEQMTPEFGEISPNERMPAIVDPDGPGGSPISIFESGAILQYLAEKTGQFGGDTPRRRVAVNEWLMWQMGGLGPMAGQLFHFATYAPSMEPPQVLPYAQERFHNEVSRLFWVMERQLVKHSHLAVDFYSIADIAAWPWVSLWRGMNQTLDDKPNLKRWLDNLKDRPALRRGRALNDADRIKPQDNKDTHALLFGQKT